MNDKFMEQEEIIKRLAEWAEEESRKAKALDEFKNSKAHLNLKSRIAKKECARSDGQWERFKEVWESYGVKFTHDDGTYKSTYEISKEMAQVFEALSDDEKENDKMHEIRYFDNKEICESDMDWQEEMRTIMTNQCRSNGAKSFKAKKAKRKMAKKSRRKNR